MCTLLYQFFLLDFITFRIIAVIYIAVLFLKKKHLKLFGLSEALPT